MNATPNNDDLIVPPSEPLPIVDGQPTRERTGTHFIHILFYLVSSLIFAFFLVLGGRWAYHKTHHKDQLATNTTSLNTTSSTSTTPQSKAPSIATNTPQNNKSTNNTTKPPASTNQTAPSKTPSKQITNTGPGNMVAVFISVSVTVAALHYIYQLRKQGS